MDWCEKMNRPKLAFDAFRAHAPAMGSVNGFTLKIIDWTMRCAGSDVSESRKLRTGLSWADSFRPNADAWFDRQMEALAEFDVTVTFCFTPEH